jgi:hypothetical protein
MYFILEEEFLFIAVVIAFLSKSIQVILDAE